MITLPDPPPGGYAVIVMTRRGLTRPRGIFPG